MYSRRGQLAGWLVLLATLASIAGCQTSNARNRVNEREFPRVILWAWERPEDLQFLNTKRYGVAFLAQTLTLKNDDVLLKPRRWPLKVSPATRLIAVTRIESRKTIGQPVALSDKQRAKLTTLIIKTLEEGNVSAVQVDFDAVVSERSFYRSLLHELRQKLPDNVPLSITALASFCVGDRWLTDLPVDEAIPMVFRMGKDSAAIKDMLSDGKDFRDGICRRSYGIAVDEPFDAKLEASRRVYVFNSLPWSVDAIAELEKRIQ
jgi:hypothetical protein